MDLTRCFAGRSGSVALPDGEPAELVVYDLGPLELASGALGIADTQRLTRPVRVPVPPGTHRVQLTSAEVDEYYEPSGARFAYLSVILSEQPAASIEPAPVAAESVDWREQPTAGIGGVAGLRGVETSPIGCLALFDADRLQQGMPDDSEDWYETVVNPPEDGWFARMDTAEAVPLGTLNARLPLGTDEERIVLAIARSELLHPILATRDAAGALTGIHIDMLVLGELSELLGAFEGQSPHAKYLLEEDMRREVLAEEARTQHEQRPGAWLRRLFGGE